MFFAACCLIDDDLSVCGEELTIDYDLQLHTELSVQLQTELAAETDAPVRRALEKWLEPVFTDRAKDIDLRFYSEEQDDIRKQIQEVINDNRTSYTLKLPMESYMHLAVANIEDNREVSMTGGAHSATMELRLPDKKEVGSLNTGVFTARLPMHVNEQTRHFDVHLYMITAAVALVIDTTGCDSVTALSATMAGSACSFSVRDSVFSYAEERTMLFEQVPMLDMTQNRTTAKLTNSEAHQQRSSSTATLSNSEAVSYACLATVGYATHDDMPWSVTVTATLTDNRHTTTTLTVKEPLKAGTLRIIKLPMNKKGGLEPDEDQEVGASVKLDWNDGGEHEVEM